MSARTFIIAEAGVNHDGSLEKALALVDVAADAGADAVKFQTFRAELLATEKAPKAAYQEASEGSDETQASMLRRLELSRSDHEALVNRCGKRSIEFLSTPFDEASAAMLVEQFGLRRLKIGSGEITNGPLLLNVARLGKPMILSTGMSTLGEVEAALSVLAYGYTARDGKPTKADIEAAFSSESGQDALANNVTLLHCITEYPAPPHAANLRAMDTLAVAFGLPVGLSDHTMGVAVATAAVARGASVIEKHFTLDRRASGPDHGASLEPDELAALVRSIRDVESALGTGRKVPDRIELGNQVVARRSLVATSDIAAGEEFTVRNLGSRRPGGGLSPMKYWELLGRAAKRSYALGDPIAET